MVNCGIFATCLQFTITRTVFDVFYELNYIT